MSHLHEAGTTTNGQTVTGQFFPEQTIYVTDVRRFPADAQQWGDVDANQEVVLSESRYPEFSAALNS